MGISYVSGQKYQVLDLSGEVRWYYNDDTFFSYEYLALLMKLVASSAGNQGKNQTAMFYEIDILGKIHGIYSLNDRMHHEFKYIGAQKIAYTGHNIHGTGVKDTIIIFNLETGQIEETINLKTFYPYKVGL